MFYRLLYNALACACAIFFSSFAIPSELIHQYALKFQSGFGQKSSGVEVYIFSDWENDARKQALIADIANKSADKARVYFVDKTNDKINLISQKNIGLLLNDSKNLEEYLRAREVLFLTVGTPSNLTENKISEALKKINNIDSQPSEENLQAVEKMFQTMFKNLQIEQTPAVIVINLKDSRQLRFDNPMTLSTRSVLEAISSLSSPSPLNHD